MEKSYKMQQKLFIHNLLFNRQTRVDSRREKMNIPDTLSHFRLAPQAPDRQHVFGWGTTTPLFHNGFKLFMNSHLNFYSFTARRIRDRSIVFDLQNCTGRIILGSQLLQNM